MKDKPKIALLKQEVYQDLYVCPATEKDPEAILLSSMGRVGPIGLVAELGADFYIIKEGREWETRIYRKVIPHIAKNLHLLKTQTLDKLPGQGFKRPGSPYPNGRFAVDGREIDWGVYDIVISINVALPTDVVLRYPRTLFAYMIGEANLATGGVHFGYDVTLNQMARGIVAERPGRVDFPYTFVGAHTLERIMRRYLRRPSWRRGIFMEINSTAERPVTSVPDHFKPLEATGEPILLHRQLIGENLTNLYDAKYFIKWGGRNIRGNSVAEAVSLGVLAVMNRNEVTHKELIIDECHATSMESLLSLVDRLNRDPGLYEKLKAKQRAVLQDLFFDKPLLSLENCLRAKREGRRPKRYTWRHKLSDRLCLMSPRKGW